MRLIKSKISSDSNNILLHDLETKEAKPNHLLETKLNGTILRARVKKVKEIMKKIGILKKDKQKSKL